MHVHNNQAAVRGGSQLVRANKRASGVGREEGRVVRAPFAVRLSPRTDADVLALFLALFLRISSCFTFSSAATGAQAAIPRRAAVICVVFIVGGQT